MLVLQGIILAVNPKIMTQEGINMSSNNTKPVTYRDSGVDIDAGNRAVELMKQHVRATYRPEVLGDIGGFGGLFALSGRYEEPVLVSGTDGVGTKLKVAFMLDRHDTIGQDAVAMCVNDILVQGAEPLFFLDYLAVGTLQPEKVAAIVSGVAKACQQSGCALIGGETAEMSGFYPDGEYDIAGFAVGIVDKKKLITGQTISPGDVLIGLPSSGLHSNGYSLVRKICFEVQQLKPDEFIPELGKTIGDELLTPTILYPKICLPLFDKFTIRGMVHITGGGFYENIPRVLPDGCGVRVDVTAWPQPAIFGLLEKWGNVEAQELYRTFNMGIGMVLVVPQQEAASLIEFLAGRGQAAYAIGEVIAGDKQTVLTGGPFHV
jgi:phosphoribosylformylglycinamidine cyclo-ligase